LQQRWFILIVALILAALLYLLAPILSPFLIGALLAYISDPFADRLEARGVGRTPSVVIVFSLMAMILLGALLLLIPQLSTQVQIVAQRLPRVIELINSELLPMVESSLGLSIAKPDLAQITAIITQHWQTTGDFATVIITSITKSGVAIAAWLANLVLIPVVFFYLLRDWDRMVANIGELLPRNVEPKVALWARESDQVLGAFMKGQLVVMLVLGVIYAIGLAILGVDLALLLGLLAGLASIVPYLGFIVGIVSSGIAAYVQFADPMILIGVAAVFAVGQLLEGMVLTPKLVGDQIGLHPVAVIFAIMAGGQLFGFVGVLLALPVAAVIRVLLSHLHQGYKNSHLYHQNKSHKNNSHQNEGQYKSDLSSAGSAEGE
jgi:predicted PurR-regulated permease PerM